MAQPIRPPIVPDPVERPMSRVPVTPQVQDTLLFQLPAELRLFCYAYTFSYPDDSPELPPQRLRPLLTCRQFYTEARLIAFAATTFTLDLHRVKNLPERLRRLRDDQVQSIRTLKIDVYRTCWYGSGPRSSSHFIPNFRPDGFPRLHLKALEINLSAEDPVKPPEGSLVSTTPVLSIIYVKWYARYFVGRRAAMNSNPSVLHIWDMWMELVVQWLDALNTDRVVIRGAKTTPLAVLSRIHEPFSFAGKYKWNNEGGGMMSMVVKISRVQESG